ncbi:MAG: hypothetical protein QOD58_4741, partial [Mycobacterium sp.]|nr:hypothetical protein [Mycobacterium sp.]
MAVVGTGTSGLPGTGSRGGLLRRHQLQRRSRYGLRRGLLGGHLLERGLLAGYLLQRGLLAGHLLERGLLAGHLLQRGLLAGHLL